jgi:hypothetical protein
MTAITVGQATATVQARQVAGRATRRVASANPNGLLARIWDAFVQGRMRQAEREIALHRHLLPSQLQEVGDRLAHSEKDLPFSR